RGDESVRLTAQFVVNGLHTAMVHLRNLVTGRATVPDIIEPKLGQIDIFRFGPSFRFVPLLIGDATPVAAVVKLVQPTRINRVTINDRLMFYRNIGHASPLPSSRGPTTRCRSSTPRPQQPT